MKSFIAFSFLAGALSACAATTIVSSNPGLPIPDNSAVGVADFLNVSSTVQSIDSVLVTLTLTGGFNGDYYAYLQHSTGFSVLLNRVGRTASNDFGYADSGIFMTFAQTALQGDVHVYQDTSNPNGGQATGTWQPDGRNIDPLNSLNTSPRDAMLNNFVGLDGSGTWTLFVADRSAGGVGTLTSWTLTINGAVPEPGSAVVLLALAGIGLCRRRPQVGSQCP